MSVTHNGRSFLWSGEPKIAVAHGWLWDVRQRVCYTQDPSRAKLLPNPDAQAAAYIKAHDNAATLSKATDCSQVEDLLPAGVLTFVRNFRGANNGHRLYPYQRVGVANLLLRPQALLGDDMGLGKSCQAIVAAQATKCKQILVVCPNSVVFTWVREIGAWAGDSADQIYILGSRAPLANATAGCRWVICPWHILQHRFKRHDELMGQAWDALIMDECHNVKSPDSQRTALTLGRWSKNQSGQWVRTPGLLDRARRVWALSGTPMPNRPIEMQQLLAALGCSWARSRKIYGKQFCDSGYNNHTGGEEFRGAKRLPELHELLISSVLVRRRKAAVLTDLPPIRHEITPLTVPEGVAGQKLRDVLRAEATSVPMETRKHLADAVGNGKAPPIEEMSELRHALARAKMPAVAAYVHDVLQENEGKRLFILGHHPDCMDLLRDLLQDRCWGARSLHGRNSKMQDRQLAVDEFALGHIDVLIAGLSVLKEGVDGLQHGSDTVIFAEPSWSPGDLNQGAARLHRIGQTNPVRALYLVVAGSLEAYMMHVALKKAEHANVALDGIKNNVK